MKKPILLFVLTFSFLFLENMLRTAHKDMDDREVTHFFSSPVNDDGVWNFIKAS